MLILLILSLLTFVVMFGGSFVINLILHRFWVNLLLYALSVGGLLVYYRGIATGLLAPFAISLFSVLLASWTFRILRNQGYALFQEKRRV